MEGRKIGNWVIRRKLGEGGMGEVWLAVHAALETPAALKALSPLFTGDAEAKKEIRRRFLQEAKLQSRLKHPHIALVMDFIVEEEQLYIVQEYLEGGSLADMIRQARGPVPLERAIAWSGQALQALGHAHRGGVVHRDVKPSNVMLDGRGEVKVLDLVAAKLIGGERRTVMGMVMGTPAYMSPEQCMSAKDVDHRADQYSMGIVLFELLTGRFPFEGETNFALMMRQVQEPPPAPRALNQMVPAEIDGIVLRALSKSPGDRFRDCGEMGEALLAASPGGRPAAEAPRRAGAAKATVAESEYLAGASVLPSAGGQPARIPPTTPEMSGQVGATRSPRLPGSGMKTALWVGAVFLVIAAVLGAVILSKKGGREEPASPAGETPPAKVIDAKEPAFNAAASTPPPAPAGEAAKEVTIRPYAKTKQGGIEVMSGVTVKVNGKTVGTTQAGVGVKYRFTPDAAAYVIQFEGGGVSLRKESRVFSEIAGETLDVEMTLSI